MRAFVFADKGRVSGNPSASIELHIHARAHTSPSWTPRQSRAGYEQPTNRVPAETIEPITASSPRMSAHCQLGERVTIARRYSLRGKRPESKELARE